MTEGREVGWSVKGVNGKAGEGKLSLREVGELELKMRWITHKDGYLNRVCTGLGQECKECGPKYFHMIEDIDIQHCRGKA